MPSPPAADLAALSGPIELLVVDVDGVLTDGVIAVDDHGVETKNFFVRDGSGIHLWRKAGRKIAILSGRWTPAVDRRAAELGIETVIQGHPQKAEPFRALLKSMGVSPAQTCYVGDDLPDLPAMAQAGLSACPADAVPEVRQAAHFVTNAPGGRGAVREVIETILKQQGAWEALMVRYQNQADAR
jgi:3-deoxy-D-manno-octulosonate 8-phosphate phosphatase (KDO 8-P phosphatase)